MSKQNDKKLEKTQEVNLKESGLRIVEVEETLKECQSRHHKELRKMKKQSDAAIEQMTNTHREFLEQVQYEHSQNIQMVNDNFKDEIEQMRRDDNQTKIKIAEMTIIRKTDA